MRESSTILIPIIKSISSRYPSRRTFFYNVERSGSKKNKIILAKKEK